MITITQNIAGERWDKLPLELREALVSDEGSDFLWTACESQNVSDTDTRTIARLVGYVIMGFLNSSQLAVEITEQTTVDSRLADALAQALGQKIFAPLRQQIAAVYSPVGPSELGPKIISDIVEQARPISAPRMTTIPTPPLPLTPPQVKPTMPPVSQMSSGAALSINATRFDGNKNAAVPPPKPPAANSTPGWSRQTPQDPAIKLGVITPAVPQAGQPQNPQPVPQQSTATPMTTSTTAQSQPQQKKVMSEFDRLDSTRKVAAPQTGAGTPTSTAASTFTSIPTSIPTSISAPTPIPMPTPKPTSPSPASTPEQGPLMLHQISSPMPVQLSSSQITGAAKDQLKTSVPIPSMPKPAVIEFGKASSSQQPRQPQQSPRQTPDFTVASGPRTFTEITATKQTPPPKPPATQPPMPQPQAQPPLPPKPPDDGNKPKVIVQNYR